MASLPVIEGKPALATMPGRAGLPKMKAGFCVSIVSIVRGRGRGRWLLSRTAPNGQGDGCLDPDRDRYRRRC
jgi:hypothetical protein